MIPFLPTKPMVSTTIGCEGIVGAAHGVREHAAHEETLQTLKGIEAGLAAEVVAQHLGCCEPWHSDAYQQDCRRDYCGDAQLRARNAGSRHVKEKG